MTNAPNTSRNGNKSPQAPETSGSLGLNYTVEAGSGDFRASALWAYSDEFFFDIANEFRQSTYSTLDLRAAWSNDRWGVAVVGENVTDEEYLAEQFLFLDVSNIRAWGVLYRVEFTLNF